MKKFLLSLVLCMMMVVVSGCEKTNEELDSTNEIETSNAGSKISDMKQIEELKKYSNKADEKYFKPQTDDFVYTLTYVSDYDTDHNSKMKLYSFDKDGRVVQYIERDYQSYGFGNYILNDEEKECTTIDGSCKYLDIVKYYSILEGATPVDEMFDQDRFSQKFEVLEDLKRDEYPLYFSKSLTRDQVNFKMTRTESEVSQVLFIPTSDDYLIQLDEEEEFHEARFTYEGELVCDAFAVKRGNVIEFNDKGEISKNTRFEILQDGYNWKDYAIYGDSVEYRFDPNAFENFKKDHGWNSNGNVIYKEWTDDYDNKKMKWSYYPETPVEERTGTAKYSIYYFSKPYLTDSQIKSFEK